VSPRVCQIRAVAMKRPAASGATGAVGAPGAVGAIRGRSWQGVYVKKGRFVAQVDQEYLGCFATAQAAADCVAEHRGFRRRDSQPTNTDQSESTTSLRFAGVTRHRNVYKARHCSQASRTCRMLLTDS
jgi:hypothetical protein